MELDRLMDDGCPHEAPPKLTAREIADWWNDATVEERTELLILLPDTDTYPVSHNTWYIHPRIERTS
jgi:hypothetical protein